MPTQGHSHTTTVVARVNRGKRHKLACVRCVLTASSLFAAIFGFRSAHAATPGDRMFDLSKEKVLYCIGYAHLDTQWRWDFTTTIDKFIRDTLDNNFERLEKYPGYVFNFTGSARYKMMKEYYPEKYERLKKYVEQGRWFVSGSSVDEGDVNVPSAEAIIRQVLYGNEFFRKEFGKESLDYMLPDCFGFPASLPSIWAHCGLKGFSTQKLTWGSAVGIPFKIGVWEGLDGKSVVAALDPGSYSTAVEGRVDLNEKWVNRVMTNGRKYGVWADFHYYGVGDQGGAPREKDVANYVASIDNPDSKIHIALTSSDQLFKDLTEAQKAELPRYRGDLLLTEHSAGTLTSEAYMKRWNRKNEILADAAERAAVFADWLGAAKYPLDKLNRSWERVLANQMHDILPGTSIPRAYTFSWNDEIVAANGFAAVLKNSIGGLVASMNTQTEGQPLIVYNPLAIDRQDLVEATVQFDNMPRAVRVYDAGGHEVPSQIIDRSKTGVKVLFSAKVPAVSLTVFDVRASNTTYEGDNELRISPTSIENETYRVTMNDNGDVASIFDKKLNRELLDKPARLVFTHERPANWPAWNMDWNDRRNPPIDYVKGPGKLRIVENGPLRVSLEVQREARDSIITQQIRLTRGSAGRHVEFKTQVDWQSTECALKASFPLTATNPQATYNWGMGTIARGNNDPTKYEVPSHEWFDLTDKSGAFGVSVLEDCKFGSDKPSDNEVRLTLLYTPGVRHSYLDQHSQDWGRHDITYALYSHKGDWREGRSEWQGRRLNQPLRLFQSTKHTGTFGRSFSMTSLNTDQVDIRALKRAEQDENTVIIRLQELWGQPAKNVIVSLDPGIAEAYEVDGQERRIGDAVVSDNQLHTSLSPFGPRSFAVRLLPPASKVFHRHSTPVATPLDSDVVSEDSDRSDGAFDSEGRSIPSEMLPRNIESDGVNFYRKKPKSGQTNAVACDGQRITLPDAKFVSFNRIYLLAAASEDTSGTFLVDEHPHELSIQRWTGFIGQWDDRIWDRPFGEVDHKCEGHVTGFKTGYIKRDDIAWFSTHRHDPTKGNEAYRFSYLYKYAIPVAPGAKYLTLPHNKKIKVLALSVAQNPNDNVWPAAPLYDDFTDRKPIKLRHVYPPPPVPVFEGVAPTARVIIDRQDSFSALKMGAPVSDDYADQASRHGVTVQYFDGGGEYRPHPASGAVNGAFPRLNDGQVAQNNDDTQRCVWYDNAGRFYIDLKKSVSIDRINTYSWHRSNRAPQYFSVWGSNATTMPDPNLSNDHREGWTLLGVVNTKKLGKGGIHGSSLHSMDGAVGTYRYLLWVVEDVGEGTFFTEIDIHAN